jgi:hypothetical protein
MQKHYDFGLRAVKSLLVMAGELKRSDVKSSEDVVLIKAMKERYLPVRSLSLGLVPQCFDRGDSERETEKQDCRSDLGDEAGQLG